MRKFLVLYTDAQYSAEQGIFRYCQNNNIIVDMIGRFDLPFLINFNPDGVILNPEIDRLHEYGDLFEHIRRKRIPSVTLSIPFKELKTISVLHDFVDIGRKLAGELIGRNFKNFLFYGYGTKVNEPEKIERGIDEVIRSHNLNISFANVFQIYKTESGKYLSQYQKNMKFKKLIGSIPKPLAVITPYGHLGNEFISLCIGNGILVPEQVAVASLCWEQYDAYSELPLSGITPDFFAQGYKAAELLDRMVQGKKIMEEVVHIPSPPFVVRASSDIIAVDNLALSKSLNYISKNFRNKGFSIREMIRNSGVCKAKLYKLFKEKFGTSPEKELMRRRLDTAKTYLLETDWKIADVAEKSGFSSNIILTLVFKRRNGVSPFKFRSRARNKKNS